MAANDTLATERRQTLRALGHYNDTPTTAAYADAVRSFQRVLGLKTDGIIGEKETGPAIDRYTKILTGPWAQQAGFDIAKNQCRVWFFTHYYLAEEAVGYVGPLVALRDPSGKAITHVSPRFFAAASLEGSGRLADGRLVNVAGRTYVPVEGSEYAPVLQIARRSGFIPDRPGYAGLKLDASKEYVAAVQPFRVVPTGELGVGYGRVQARAHIPGYTLATDIGAFGTSDPKYRKTGGVIPRGTFCWVPDVCGRQFPTTQMPHDGRVQAVDSGGGIDGNQADWFMGTKAIADRFHIPSWGHLWYRGIEDRLPFGYMFGKK